MIQRRMLLPAAACLALALIPAFAPQSDESGAKAARELLDKGQFEEALSAATAALEWLPEDFTLLEIAAQAAAKAEKKDEALWYAGEALDSAGPSPAKERVKLVEGLQALVTALDPCAQRGRIAIGEYAQAVLSIGVDLCKRKLPVSGVGLLSRALGSPLAERAGTELQKVYDNKKAVLELLESGVDVPTKAKKKRDPKLVAKEDAAHSTWDKCWEIKGDCYTIRTDMSRAMAEDMSLAMEQVNKAYRRVFHVKERGGDTARCIIHVYKTRAGFDEQEPGTDKNVAGFFVPNVNRVATYDPRTDGREIADLWSTLFHEASHQFTHMVSADLIPGWLNEGTASYFEGAQLLSNGSVRTNLVPEGRLSDLLALLARGDPLLKDVVSYYKQGSYDGTFYPFGWGLVYFLHNYENERSERVYLPVYRDYMLSYKSGGKHDPFGRFVEFFVTKAKQPGVTSFEEFEQRWKEWIQELGRLYNGGEEVADDLLKRARKQHVDKKGEYAVESYQWALRKRPTDAVAYLELGEILAATKQTDAAFHNFHKCNEVVRGLPDDSVALAGSGELSARDIASAARTKAQKIDKAASDARAAADLKFSSAVLEAAKAYHDAASPRAALQLLASAREMYGRSASFDDLATTIATESKIDIRRTRRLGSAAEDWESADGWSIDRESISATATGLDFVYSTVDLPERFRYEVRLDPSGLGKEGVMGIVFGAGSAGLQLVAVFPDGIILPAKSGKDGLKPKKELGRIDRKKLAGAVLAIEVSDGEVSFYGGDKLLGKRPYSGEETAGQIGLFVQNGTGKFSDVRVRY